MFSVVSAHPLVSVSTYIKGTDRKKGQDTSHSWKLLRRFFTGKNRKIV